jgi:hypothetical protein
MNCGVAIQAGVKQRIRNGRTFSWPSSLYCPRLQSCADTKHVTKTMAANSTKPVIESVYMVAELLPDRAPRECSCVLTKVI